MDLCAPCDRYDRALWGRNLHLEDCCLNCSHLDDYLPCPTLSSRIYPSDREVIRSTSAVSTCGGCEGSAAGGDKP